jgi:hypothetical protein
MSATDDLLTANEAYARTFDRGELPLRPRATWPSSPAWTPVFCLPGRSASRKGTRT